MNSIFQRIHLHYLALLIVGVTSLGSPIAVGQMMPGQEKPEPPPKNIPVYFSAEQLQAMSLDQIAAEIEQLKPQLKTALKTMVAARLRFRHGTSAESYRHGKDWREGAVDGRAAFLKLKELVMAQYLKTSSPSEDQSKLAATMALQHSAAGRYGDANRVLKKVLTDAPNIENRDGLQFEAARIAIMASDFQSAWQIPTDKELVKRLSPIEKSLFIGLGQLEAAWKVEQAIREQEAAADDLPRVEFETTKGKFVVELFENEAPHTVGNFISLVKSGYYKDRFFHMVLRNFRAQTGLYSRHGSPLPDYRIVNEANAENARQIFRGSLVMTPTPADAAAQFAIYNAPNAYNLNKEPSLKVTVFGRVISGMSVIDALKVNARFQKGTTSLEPVNNRQGDMPNDYIINATVIRSRPSVDYKPKKIK